jgi:erythromycin esterase-like protein
MVTRHGARALFMESPWLQARLADDYVLTCEGDVEDALAGFFYYIWFDAAVRDTLDWLCAFNQEHPDDPVRVYGMDIQNSFDDVTGLEVWLPELTDDAAAIVEQLRQCPNAGFEDVRAIIADQSIADPSAPACEAGLNALDQVLMGAEESEAAVLSGLAATSLRAVLALARADGAGRMTARDTGMADVMMAQWDGETPAIVYMANSHASRAHDQTADPNYAVAGGRSVGTVLAERLGEGYVAIATTGDQLGVNRKGTATLIDNAGPETLTSLLQTEGVDSPVTLVDFGADDAGALQDVDGRMILFGRPYAVRFARQFDAIVHLAEAAPMFDAVAAAYDGPYLFDWETFDHRPPVAYEQAPYTAISMDGTGLQGAWQLHARQRTLPPFDTPIDLAGSNAVELFLARNGSYWFAVRGTVTYTGSAEEYDVQGTDLVFWPLYSQSWVVPGSAAIRIAEMQAR